MSFICESNTMRGSTSSSWGQIVGQGGAKFAYRSQAGAKSLAREGQNLPIARRNWGMEVAPEVSTATQMAFPSWEMSRGKVYQLRLGIHDQQGI